MQAGAEKLHSRKTGFRMQHVGDLLARHEDFCAGKVAEEKISPGISNGLGVHLGLFDSGFAHSQLLCGTFDAPLLGRPGQFPPLTTYSSRRFCRRKSG